MLSINQVFLFFSLFSSKNMVIPNPHSLRMWKSSCAYLDLNFQWLARPFCPFGILVLASSGVQMVTEAGSKHSPRPHPLPTSTAQSLHSQDVTPILWPCDARNWLIGKDPDTGKGWKQKKGMTEDEMFGWHHRLDGHESEQALWVGDGQGSLACFSPWGSKESDTTEQLNWTYIGNSQVKLGFLFHSSLNIILFVYLFLLCCLCCHAGFPLVEENKASL